MKKLIILTALSLFYASSALASGTLTLSMTTTGLSVYGAKSGTASTTTPLIGKTSTGVGVGLNTAATGYGVVTQHKNGTKAFGSAYDSTSVYSKDVTAGTADNTTINTGVDTFASGWTSM